MRNRKRILDNINIQLLGLHLELSNIIRPDLWPAIVRVFVFGVETNAVLTTIKQENKFNQLKKTAFRK